MKYGFDVSKHQGIINWDSIKTQGLDFCYIRLGYRGYVSGKLFLDEMFLTNLEGIERIGMEHGFYFFSAAISLEEVKEEAEFVIFYLKNLKFNLPVVYDFEGYNDRSKRTFITTKELRTAMYLEFKKIINSAGYSTMVYEGQFYINKTYDLSKISDPIWCARYYKTTLDMKYRPDIGVYSNRIRYWQYTNKGKIKGIEGDVDLNVAFDMPNEAPYKEPVVTLYLGNIKQSKDDVKWLQWHLKRLGYLPKYSLINGKFNARLRGAFKLFQLHNPETFKGDIPDCKCGPKSREYLKK